jgi:uncharacterized protein (TIGR00255 family)
MTGYGAAALTVAGARITAEIRSVNHRFLDLRIAVPREYARWEGDLRELVRDAASRGRIELYVSRVPGGGGARVRVDVRPEVGRAYVQALRRLKAEMRLAGDIDVGVLRGVPGLVGVTEVPVRPEGEIAGVRRVVRRAVAAFVRDRRREGRALAADMRRNARELERLVNALEAAVPGVLAGLRTRVEERLRRLAGAVDIDPQRLAQEAAILAERGDVSEELVRLRSHVAALKRLLSETAAIGKRVEFLLQELQRETNTVGSKLGDPRISALVVAGKAVLEKLREQVQNVE